MYASKEFLLRSKKVANKFSFPIQLFNTDIEIFDLTSWVE